MWLAPEDPWVEMSLLLRGNPLLVHTARSLFDRVTIHRPRNGPCFEGDD